MSVKPCTFENMLSTTQGMGMARNWYPRIAQEAFLTSTKDGPIKRAPDPVTMIDGDLSWTNSSKDPQFVHVQVLRAPRSVVAQSPSTVVIYDAWSFAVGSSPTADYPSVIQDTFGGKLQCDRPEAAAEDLLYGRQFYESDASQAWVTVGEIAAGEALHFRYLAAVQTPGVWTEPTKFTPDWEATALWARLLAFAYPVGSS